MGETTKKTPDYIIESSWEVCNKVGGIYTVLSTRALTLHDKFKDKLIFIGPDFWIGKENPLFIEDEKLYDTWADKAKRLDNLKVRVGRWNIPGKPVVILVDFKPFFEMKDEIYTKAWEYFQVDSLHAYGDYDEASMFSYAAGRVVLSLYKRGIPDKTKQKVIYQAHEWMTGLGALFVKHDEPRIATIFTTHATSIGRSIAGNNKPLYDCMPGYNGDQMADELNMQSKHSIEKQTAHRVDCFTTVSEITARECKQLLDIEPAVILKNGFENKFVSKSDVYIEKRKVSRERILNVAGKLMGYKFNPFETVIIGTGGRYEYKNKGLDLFLESLARLNHDEKLKKNIVAVINVPAWVGSPREDLLNRLNDDNQYDYPLPEPVVTHNLNDFNNDNIINNLHRLGLHNGADCNVKVMFVPCYLDGKDGIMNATYYDMMPAYDLNVYASYYEPWGYTPLESVAFSVPCITTDLTGFGLWVNSLNKSYSKLFEGVEVVHRTDSNFDEAAEHIKDTMEYYANLTEIKRYAIGRKAKHTANLALWKHFIEDYYEAYDVALTRSANAIRAAKARAKAQAE